jgi:hypothetical protein
LPGCGSHDECRIYRADTNGDGVITVPASGETAVDRLTYDTASTATCSTATYRCVHPAGPGSPRGGTPCVRDSQCETDGECLGDAATGGAWPGGYCIRFGCDLAGVTCAAGGHCQERRLGVSACVQDCRVGSHVGGDRFAAHTSCRTGYQCVWDGVSGAAATVNGACLPGEYNAVRASNVGAACTTSATCVSPYGAGRCVTATAFTGGYCVVDDCAAPGLAADVCGADGACVELDPADSFSMCLDRCTTATDCRAGYGCTDLGGGTRTCYPACTADGDCRVTERCSIPAGETFGTCV